MLIEQLKADSRNTPKSHQTSDSDANPTVGLVEFSNSSFGGQDWI